MGIKQGREKREGAEEKEEEKNRERSKEGWMRKEEMKD